MLGIFISIIKFIQELLLSSLKEMFLKQLFLDPASYPTSYPQDTPQAEIDTEDKRTKLILEFCREPKTRKEIQEFLDIKDRKYLANSILKPLIKRDILKLTKPDKPTSPNQKYYSEKQIID